MLIGDARIVLDGLRKISESLASKVPLNEDQSEMLKDLEMYMTAGREDCLQTLDAVEAVDLEGIQRILKSGGIPEPSALKVEVDKIIETLADHDD